MSKTFEETLSTDQINQLGSNVRREIDETRQPAADSLEKAANVLHEQAEHLPVGRAAAHNAAGKIQGAAEYIRRNELGEMMADVKALIRKYPGRSLAAAALAGFFIGRAFIPED